jgi:hypothetical protein
MSDDLRNEEAAPPSGEPSAPDTATAETAPAPASTGEEVEYVYEDEHGNRIAAPEGGFDTDAYEEVAVEKPSEPAAPDATSTQRLLKPGSSSRRSGDRKSGRQPKPMTPEEIKKVRRKVILLLSLLTLIPILGIALLVMMWQKGHIRFGSKKPTTRTVDNDFDQGEKIYQTGSPHYQKANLLYDQGKRAEAYAEYKLCEKDYVEAQNKIRKWIEGKDTSQYHQVETLSRQINIELRAVRERMLMLEASGNAGGPKPPPPPETPASP